MIPQAYITEWRATAPWSTDAQVEQDLILSRALIEIYTDPLLAECLAFRGGTALHKLFIQPSGRYSEDIDLVQVKEGSIGSILETLRKKLNPWLGEPKWKLKEGRAIFVYRFDSESHPVTPMRVKIEINTREHFTVLGLSHKFFETKSLWFSSQAMLTTYSLEELLGTKLRALYQRKKGRDLFDLIMALEKFPSLKISDLIHCFENYMSFTDKKVSRAEFEKNLAEKLDDVAFLGDIKPLLPSTAYAPYDPLISGQYLQQKIIDFLPGESWKGAIR